MIWFPIPEITYIFEMERTLMIHDFFYFRTTIAWHLGLQSRLELIWPSLCLMWMEFLTNLQVKIILELSILLSPLIWAKLNLEPKVMLELEVTTITKSPIFCCLFLCVIFSRGLSLSVDPNFISYLSWFYLNLQLSKNWISENWGHFEHINQSMYLPTFFDFIQMFDEINFIHILS